MSSILKALKKLEQETPQTAYPRLWVRRTKQANTRLLLIGGLIFIGLAAVAGSAFFFKQDRPIRAAAPRVNSEGVQGASAPASRPETPGLKGASARNASATTALGDSEHPNTPRAEKESGPAVAGRAHDTRPKPMAASPHPTPARSITGETASPKSTAHVSVATTPQIDGAKPRAGAPELARSAEPASPVNTRGMRTATLGSGAVQEQAPEIPARHLTDTGLKIQAISWSVNPAERIAVVNSRIVREGQAIEDFRIKKINIDDILLTKDGVDWTLRFINN